LKLATAACAVVAAVVVPTAAAATTRYVSPSGQDVGNCTASPCRTIGYALTQASNRDTVLVAPGTYAEAVDVTKTVNLVGASGGSVIDATGHDNGVVITSPGTTMRGFTVEHATFEGIVVQGTHGVLVQNNRVANNDLGPCPETFDDCGEALHLNGVTSSIVRGNLVQDNVGGILLTDEAGPTSHNLITDNSVLDNTKDCGITLASHYFSMSAAATASQGGVYDNTVLHNDSERNGAAGIGVFTGPPGAAAYRNVVAGNVAIGNGAGGIDLHSNAPFQYLNDNVVVNNVVGSNGPDDETDGPVGISIFSVLIPIQKTVVAANRISHEQYGIYTLNAVKTGGLPSNKFADVTVPVSIH
jgi:nitrous oxidase accessory protein NosD